MAKIKLKTKHGNTIEYDIAYAERILRNQSNKGFKGFEINDKSFYFKDNKIVKRKSNTEDTSEGAK